VAVASIDSSGCRSMPVAPVAVVPVAVALIDSSGCHVDRLQWLSRRSTPVAVASIDIDSSGCRVDPFQWGSCCASSVDIDYFQK